MTRPLWETNVSTLDPWTAAHFAWGLFARSVGIPFWLTMLIAMVFEWLEMPLERLFPSVFPYRTTDTMRNAAGDVVGVAAGWAALDTLLQAWDSSR